MFKRVLPFLVPIVYLLLAGSCPLSDESRLLQRDPTYYYLMNSFNIALGEPAHYFAHPGTPLQLLGGLASFLKFHLFPESTLPMREEFIAHQGLYLRRLSQAAIAINALLLALAGWLALARAPVAWVVMTQVSFFLAPIWLVQNGLFSPEAFLFSFGSLLWMGYLAKPKQWWRLPAIVGILMAGKANFAGHLLAIGCLKPKRIFAALLVSAISFFLLCLCLYPEFTSMRDWFWLGAVNRGDYTSGQPGFLSLAEIRAALAFHELGDSAAAVLALPVLALLLLGFFSGGPSPARRRWFSAAAVILASTLIYLKKPTHSHYLLPAYAALPSFLFLMYPLVRRRIYAMAVPVTVLLLLGAMYPVYFRDATTKASIDVTSISDRALLSAELARRASCATLISGPVVDERSALLMGSDWAGSSWAKVLNGVFPHTYFIAPEGGNIRTFLFDAQVPMEWRKNLKQACVNFITSPDSKTEVALRTWMLGAKLVLEGQEFRLYSLEI